MMGGAGHIAYMNKTIKYNRSLIKRKRLSENELLKMPIGKNSKILTKRYLSEEEKLVLSRKYLEFYRKERVKTFRIVVISIVITAILVWGSIYAFMHLI